MRIFITGATGYIGFNVALALRRAGHEVWGLMRNADKARVLASHEIYPVIGTMQEPDSYRAAAVKCSVLVHAASDPRADTIALDRKTVEVLIGCGTDGPKPKTLVYTSGVWLYGNTGAQLADETSSPNPPRLVAWRPAVEQLVLQAPSVRGVVVRPGCVYGRQGGLTGAWFADAHGNKPVRVVGDGKNRWTMVHVDDLADGYLRLIESGCRGEIFNFTDRSRATIGEMAHVAVRSAGSSGRVDFVPVAEAEKAMGDLAVCLALDQHVDSRKAVRLLGWQPKHGGFVDEADLFYSSWKAAQE